MIIAEHIRSESSKCLIINVACRCFRVILCFVSLFSRLRDARNRICVSAFIFIIILSLFGWCWLRLLCMFSLSLSPSISHHHGPLHLTWKIHPYATTNLLLSFKIYPCISSLKKKKHSVSHINTMTDGWELSPKKTLQLSSSTSPECKQQNTIFKRR